MENFTGYNLVGKVLKKLPFFGLNASFTNDDGKVFNFSVPRPSEGLNLVYK